MKAPRAAFQIFYESKGRSVFSGLPFHKMKDAALGKKYNLNLIFTTSRQIRKLNRTYRERDEATDILTFPLDPANGEIYISLREAEIESMKFARKPKNFVQFLFIHGLIHLKGHDHGSTMEHEESKIRKKFGI